MKRHFIPLSFFLQRFIPGKYVPTISKKIHDENEIEQRINFKGLAVGNGAMAPPDCHVYGDFLYQLGLIDQNTREGCKSHEAAMKNYTANGQWTLAWLEWNAEVNLFLGEMGCNYYLDHTQCHEEYEEGNYNDYVNKESTRIAAHVGDIPFGKQSGEVYNKLIPDIMKSEKETVEFLLERYPVLFYNGNLDIVCHHTGTIEMLNAMENWSGKEEFLRTSAEIFEVNGDTAGYLTSVQNLRLLAVRNAGHMVPRSQPEVAYEMFSKFLQGNL